MSNYSGKASVLRRKQGCNSEAQPRIGSSETDERLQEFIEYFVQEFEGKLLSYHLILEGKLEPSGKFTELFSSLIGQGAGGAVRGVVMSSFDTSAAAGNILGKISEKAVEKLCREIGSAQRLKKIVHLSDLIDLSQKRKAHFRKTLVQAGFDIFQSFEMQFMRVTTDKGTKDAVHNLAKDAVNRAINHIKLKKDALISEGVILGKSSLEATPKLLVGNARPGFKIAYEYESQKKTWYTADLYEKVGLTVTQESKTTFYNKRGSTSDPSEYGYRRLLTWENWDEMKEKYQPDNDAEQKRSVFKDYKYILNLEDLHVKLEKVLKSINDCDEGLVEERIKEVMIEVKRDIIEEIIKRPEYEEHRETLARIEANLANIKTDELLQKFKQCFEDARRERKETENVIKEGFQDAYQHRQEIGNENRKEHENIQRGLEKVDGSLKKVRTKQKQSKQILLSNKKSIERIERNQCLLNERMQTLMKEQEQRGNQRMWFYVREPLKSFTGRGKVLKDLADKIRKYGTIAICGLSGVGKSELAIKYVRNNFSQEGNAVWISAGSRDAVRTSFLLLHRKLGYKLSPKDEREEDIRSIAEDVYLHLSDKKTLIILDDATSYDDIHDVLPLWLDPQFNKPEVLITCKDLAKSTLEKLFLSDFTTEEAVDFIRKSLGIKDEKENIEMVKLVNTLHNFPLALHQAATYIIQERDQRDGRFTIGNYLEEYEKKTEELLNYKAFQGTDNYSQRTAFTALQMTLDKIKEHEYAREAFKTLYIMAFLAPDNIPEEMILQLVRCDKKKLQSFILLLKEYSVVRYAKTLLSIHGLVQQIIKLQFHERNEEGVEETILNEILLFIRKHIVDYKGVQCYTRHAVSVWDNAYKYDTLIDRFIFSDSVGETTHTTYFHLICEGNRYEIVEHVLNKIKESHPDYLAKLVNEQNLDESTPLHSAVLSGDERTVRLLIDNGADVNAARKHKWAPLHFATKNGYLEIVRTLLRKGASINAKTEYGFMPLHFAVKKNYIKVVNVLLSKGADVNVKNNRGFTPLHFAVDNNCEAVVRALLSRNARIDDKTRHEYTSLHLAAKAGLANVFSALLEKNADVHAKTRLKFTPLHFAAQSGNISIVEALLNKKAAVDAKDANQFTPLHLAAMNGHIAVVNTLLKQNAAMNAETSRGTTALHFAAQKGHLDVFNTLIEKGADFEAITHFKFTLLHLAAENGHLNIVQILLNRDVAIDAKDEDHLTPLHLASKSGHTSIVNILLNQNASVNAETITHSTPLHLAAENGHLEVFKILASKGANVQAETYRKDTPLHFAAMNGHLSIVLELLNTGITIDASNEDHFTPLHLAAMNGHAKVVHTLLQQEATIYAETTGGRTPLHLAAENGHSETFEALLDAGADDEAETDLKLTPLHLAAANGHLNIVQALLKRAVALDVKDKNHFTPLHLAAMNGHTSVISTLLKQHAIIDAKTTVGYTPLHLAAGKGRLEAFKVLIAGGTDDEAKTCLKHTPLHLASDNGHLKIVQELLNRGVTVDAEDENQLTPLHMAAVNGHADVTNALLNQNCNINAKTNEGNTPLHLAASQGHFELVKDIIEKKPDVNIRNKENKTALDLAIEGDYTEIRDYIIQLSQNTEEANE